MIVCLRTVDVPAAERARYLAWIAEGRRIREAVDYHPITRYEIAAGYLNLPALAAQPDNYPTTEDKS